MTKKNAIHLRGLNGFRTFGALAVVITHLCIFAPFFGLEALSPPVKNPYQTVIGDYAITLFFVLSGFLVTYLLLKEKEKKPINIKKFYIRRILRIWPLYYLYLFFCVVIYLVFEIGFDPADLLFYVFLSGNLARFTSNALPYLEHFWFLGIICQFYFLWPWVVTRYNNKKLLKVAVVFVLGFYGAKLLFYLFQAKYSIMSIVLSEMSANRFHIIAIGCIGALLYYGKSKWMPFFLNIKTQLFCWLILLLAMLDIIHVSTAVVDHEIVAVVFTIIVFGQIEGKNMFLNMDNKVFDFIGKISFGIYIIHPLFMFLTYKIFGTFEESSIENYLFLFSFVVLGSVVLAYLSYAFYEKRFINIKWKFANIKSRS